MNFKKQPQAFRKYDTEKDMDKWIHALNPVKKLLAVGNFTELYAGYNIRAGKKDEKGVACSQVN